MTTAPWRDPSLTAAVRVDDLLSRMTLEEKTAQLYGVWVGAATDGDGVAPLQHEMTAYHDWDELITLGLGQLTRSFGTAPVDPELGARALARAQRAIAACLPLRHPGGRPRGVPGGIHRLARDGLSRPARLGRHLRPGPGRGAGRTHRRRPALGRRAPGPGARPRRGPRPALGPGGGDDRRGPVPRRHDRHGLCAGPGIGRDRRHAEALRRVRVVGGGTEPGAGASGRAGVRGRHARAVRDGAARGRRPFGDGGVQRDGRRPGVGGRPAADRTPAGAVGLHRNRGRRLLRRRFPPDPAPGGGKPGRGGPRGAGGRLSTSNCRR